MKISINLNRFLQIGMFILLAILLLNFFFVYDLEKSLNAKIAEAKEFARPAKIEIIKIESSCKDCFDADAVIKNLKSSGLEITGEKSLSRNSQDALKLIKQYKIEKLPNIILKGEINKTTIQDFKQVDDVLVFDAVLPPYENAATKKIMGKVSSVIIKDKSCKVCTDFNLALQNLKQNGVFIGKEENLDFSESKAKELIDKFAIKRLPALLLSSDIEAYPDIALSLSQLKSKDSSYYIIESQAPYVEADSGKLRGLAKLTFINDSSCSKCYDVKIHRLILSRFGIAVDKENEVDVNSAEGKQLASKYSIKNVPTIVLTGDLDVYENFKIVWGQVGTVENDGAYVFREIDALGEGIVYMDTSTNEIKIVEPTPKPTGQE